jgi:hypothetical protein
MQTAQPARLSSLELSCLESCQDAGWTEPASIEPDERSPA